MQARTLTLALAVATGLAAMIGGVAAANDSKLAPTTRRLALPGAPPDYELRVRGPITAPAGTVTRATVKCKAVRGALEHALGGGALVTGSGTQVGLASDYPPLGAESWSVSVVNQGSAAILFNAYAICAHDTADSNGETFGWSVAPHSTASSQTVASPGCNMDVSGPQDQGPNLMLLHETRPTLTANWTFGVGNESGTTRFYNLLDECSQIPGAHVVHGPLVSNPPGAQTQAVVMCDAGVPLAGGVGASSSSPLVSVNSSYPITGGWAAFENNASTQTDSIRAWVVCSGS
jgi:hypothetical protein